MSVIVVSVIVSIAAVVGCLSYYASGPDNKVEEACEEIIKIETGQDIDLSLDSIENQQEKLQQAPVVSPLAGVNGTSLQ